MGFGPVGTEIDRPSRTRPPDCRRSAWDKGHAHRAVTPSSVFSLGYAPARMGATGHVAKIFAISTTHGSITSPDAGFFTRPFPEEIHVDCPLPHALRRQSGGRVREGRSNSVPTGPKPTHAPQSDRHAHPVCDIWRCGILCSCLRSFRVPSGENSAPSLGRLPINRTTHGRLTSSCRVPVRAPAPLPALAHVFCAFPFSDGSLPASLRHAFRRPRVRVSLSGDDPGTAGKPCKDFMPDRFCGRRSLRCKRRPFA